MILQPNGFNHVAICTLDMRKTLLYFNDALGLPLAALYWMHGVKGTVHGFLAINEPSLLGFVYHPSVNPNIQVGKTHPGTMDGTSAKGTMHHLSFNVESMEGLASLQDRLDAKGITYTFFRDGKYTSSGAIIGGGTFEINNEETNLSISEDSNTAVYNVQLTESTLRLSSGKQSMTFKVKK